LTAAGSSNGDAGKVSLGAPRTKLAWGWRAEAAACLDLPGEILLASTLNRFHLSCVRRASCYFSLAAAAGSILSQPLSGHSHPLLTVCHGRSRDPGLRCRRKHNELEEPRLG
jgi:hypothetical protein